jgi:hypothetical protein
VRNVPVGSGFIDLRHIGRRETILTNHGDTTIDWEASFAGAFATLIVDGKQRAARIEMPPLNRTVTSVTIRVPPRARVHVRVPK